MAEREKTRTIEVSESVYDVIEKIAQDRRTVPSVVVRDAVALEKLYDDTKRSGGEVLVRRAGKTGRVTRLA